MSQLGCPLDQIRKRFPALVELIEEKRTEDSGFAEICDDLETLVTILETKGLDLEPQARQNVLESIRGLENEISKSVALDRSSAKPREWNT